ncbi:MAG: cupredoxin domain-containing protein [Armatimonadota bacterium]|nr:cupredoxin domain-containing protein [Armatimonadota bacterium]MDW8156984.1 cupredoxin domain-containing protein [Armatimonadota bacterium]
MKKWVVTGVAVAVLSAGTVALYAGAPIQKVTVVAKEFTYTPNKLTVKAGLPVQLVLENKGVIEHDFVVDALKVKTGAIQPGKSGTVTFTPRAKGSFPFYCSIPGHKEAGMTGTLVVQ